MSEDSRLTTVRQLLSQIGHELRQARNDAELSLADVEARTKVSKPALSLIENGKRVPTEHEWEVLAALLQPATALRQLRESARVTDPAQSHETAQSIADDGTMVERIIAVAQWVYPDTFDDTDLVHHFQTVWPRPIGSPWQRNVIAKCRVGIHSFQVEDGNGGRRRQEDPLAPIRRAGTRARPERGHQRETDHFVYVPEAHRHDHF